MTKYLIAAAFGLVGMATASANCILNDRSQFVDQPCWVRVVFDTAHSGGPGGE